MCLGIPGQVVEIDENSALVDFWGSRRRVRLETVDEPVKPGDYVLVHVGFAIRRIPEEEVKETLSFYEELIRLSGEGPMETDIRSELSSTDEGGTS